VRHFNVKKEDKPRTVFANWYQMLVKISRMKQRSATFEALFSILYSFRPFNMKKLLIALCLLPLSLLAQSNQVKLICNVTDVPVSETLTLYEFIGLAARPIQKATPTTGTTTFTFNIPAGAPKFYAVGVNETSVARVILGAEPEVKLWANAQFMNKARTMGSKPNSAYEAMVKRTLALSDPMKREASTNKAKTAYLDSLKRVDPFLWRSATLLLPPQFEGLAGQGEIDFYGKNWFRNADLAKDRAYDEVPDVYYSAENYIRTIRNLGANDEQLQKGGTELLALLPVGSKTYRMVLGGLITGCQAVGAGPTQVHFAQKYIEMYKNQDLGEMARLEYEVGRASTSTVGMVAPNLVGMTPDSSTYQLTNMRGKVVLIDFWASWCGPCRRENPNVKLEYAKYKDKGFDILGVSLDRDHAAWVKAIEADGLPWHHISDLKGWQSSHAALYSVSSIPQTLLLDREGRIIERNLRGEALGAKLKQIFGE
jgi:thiol-disulfide isomerase/thioredoxin